MLFFVSFNCILETQSFVLNLWKFLAVSISAEESNAKQVKKLSTAFFHKCHVFAVRIYRSPCLPEMF